MPFVRKMASRGHRMLSSNGRFSNCGEKIVQQPYMKGEKTRTNMRESVEDRGHKQMHGDVIDIWIEQIKHRGRQPE